MENQIDLFSVPSEAGSLDAPCLTPLAIAAILEANLACDRAGFRVGGRVGFIREFLRIAWDSPFSNCRELCPEITRVLEGYDAFPDSTRSETERLRSTVANHIMMKLLAMQPGKL